MDPLKGMRKPDFVEELEPASILQFAQSLSEVDEKTLTLKELLHYKCEKSQNWLIKEQHPEGYWQGLLEGDSSVTSEYVLFSYFFDRLRPDVMKKIIRFLRSQQQEDGGWNIYHGGESEINSSVKAYFALKLCRVSPNEEFMRKARQFIIQNGGLHNTNTYLKIYLALFGQYDWAGCPTLLPEITLLPKWFYFNLYNMSYCARTIVTPLLVICSLKPSIHVPEELGLKEIWDEDSRDFNVSLHQYIKGNYFGISGVIMALDYFSKYVAKLPFRPGRKKALKGVERWIVEHMPMSDGLGAIWPAMFNSVLALHTLGYPSNHPIMEHSFKEVEALAVENNREFFVQPCLSPIWDTAISLMALKNSGLSSHHPSLINATDWLVSKQTHTKGDWSENNPTLEPGGWAFQFNNEFFPDLDDTAMVLMAIHKNGSKTPDKLTESCRKGIQWVLGMQNSDGGWAAFDRDNNKMLFTKLPFSDMNAVVDPSTADITARCLEMMGDYGYIKTHPVAQKALQFLKSNQEQDGSWFGRWGVNYIYGTWSVLAGLNRIQEDMQQPYIQKSLDWLCSVQHEDGGWGETCITYQDPSKKGQGRSTPSQTAWAILALIEGGRSQSSSTLAGVQYLLNTQLDNGSWNEIDFTGAGFPKVFCLRYNMYRHYFPLMALGKFYKTLL